MVDKTSTARNSSSSVTKQSAGTRAKSKATERWFIRCGNSGTKHTAVLASGAIVSPVCCYCKQGWWWWLLPKQLFLPHRQGQGFHHNGCYSLPSRIEADFLECLDKKGISCLVKSAVFDLSHGDAGQKNMEKVGNEC